MTIDASLPHAELTREEFSWIAGFLREHTGIELRPGKEALVMGRLERRLRHHGLSTYAEYCALLTADPQEVRHAVDLLTTNETSFFREAAHFAFLREILGGRPALDRPLRIWSAASSSGEEAWSIAMTLADCLPVHQPWEVIGTDISLRVLRTAAQGIYPLAAAQKIPADLLKEHCRRGRGDFEGRLAVAGRVRQHVTFRHANLLSLPSDLGIFDIVFLRNVMIYFSAETKAALVTSIEGLLRPGGHLIVSHAETLNGLGSSLKLVKPSIYRAAGGEA